MRNEEDLSKEVTFELDLSRSRSRPPGEIAKSKRKDEDAGAGRSRDETKVPEPVCREQGAEAGLWLLCPLLLLPDCRWNPPSNCTISLKLKVKTILP